MRKNQSCGARAWREVVQAGEHPGEWWEMHHLPGETTTVLWSWRPMRQRGTGREELSRWDRTRRNRVLICLAKKLATCPVGDVGRGKALSRMVTLDNEHFVWSPAAWSRGQDETRWEVLAPFRINSLRGWGSKGCQGECGNGSEGWVLDWNREMSHPRCLATVTGGCCCQPQNGGHMRSCHFRRRQSA